MAEAARKAALQDGQDAGTAVIYAEAKLGELLAAIPRKYVGSPKKTDKAQLPSLPPGISKRTSHQAQTIANNPEKVEVANELYAARVANMAVGGDGSNQHVSKSANMPNSRSADLPTFSQPEAARLFNVSERTILSGSSSASIFTAATLTNPSGPLLRRGWRIWPLVGMDRISTLANPQKCGIAFPSPRPPAAVPFFIPSGCPSCLPLVRKKLY